jgi:hypothetical protein
MTKSCGCSTNIKSATYVLLFALVFIGTMSLIMTVGGNKHIFTREGLENASTGEGDKMTIQPLPYSPGGSNPEREKLNQNLQVSNAEARENAKNDEKVKTPPPPPAK